MKKHFSHDNTSQIYSQNFAFVEREGLRANAFKIFLPKFICGIEIGGITTEKVTVSRVIENVWINTHFLSHQIH